MPYTVKQLADLAGVSVRTLHYYDEIGLLKPSSVATNGYRSYDEAELLKLQQILFFRELEFPLEKITKIMGSKQFSPLGAMYDQRQLLELKAKRTRDLLKTLNKTISSLEHKTPMQQDDTFSAFNDPDYQKYKDEVVQRWGNTDAYKQSQERMKKMTKADIDKLKADGIIFVKKLAAVFTAGVPFNDPEMQELVDQQYNTLRTWYEPNYEMFKGLGEMYVVDPRFTVYYDKHAVGLAAYVRDAMVYYADQHMK